MRIDEVVSKKSIVPKYGLAFIQHPTRGFFLQLFKKKDIEIGNHIHSEIIDKYKLPYYGEDYDDMFRGYVWLQDNKLLVQISGNTSKYLDKVGLEKFITRKFPNWVKGRGWKYEN